MFQKYHEVDIDVIRKDGIILIREMAAEVKNMMDFKMSAVMVRKQNIYKTMFATSFVCSELWIQLSKQL